MENKNQTESLKFRKEDSEPSNPYNNVLTSEQHRIWKRRNKVKATLATGAMVVGVGGGIGAGYAIGHSQNNHPTPVLALSASISNNNLKIGTEGTATLSVTEINADGWTEPAVTVPTGLTASGSWTVSGLTGTTTISLSSGSSLVAGSYTIAISANGASIDQNVSVAPATPTPALSASISNNNLQLGTTGTATLSVTEINTTDWTDPTLTVPTGLTASRSWSDSTNPLTKTTIIFIDSSNPPIASSYTITISASGYTAITQTITVLPEITSVISPMTLANDPALFAACNLEINPFGLLNKRANWDIDKNTTFTDYLNNHHITTIRFEGIISIAYEAFYNCVSLTASITFPPSLTTINSYAFLDCAGLHRIEFDTSLSDATVSIGDGAFSGCTNLTGFWKTSSANHLYLSSINHFAFEGCANLSIDGINGIEVSEQNLEKVENKNDNGTTIGIGIVNTTWDQANCMITGDMGSTLNSYFSNSSSIDFDAFNGCASLTSLDLSGLASTLISINSYAFCNCTSLTSLDLSPLTALTTIATQAFENCPVLTTLKLSPVMFTSGNSSAIASRAFYGCTSLNAIYLPADAATLPNSYNSNAFDNCSTNGTIWYHNDSQTDIANSFKNAFNAFKDNDAWLVKKNPTP